MKHFYWMLIVCLSMPAVISCGEKHSPEQQVKRFINKGVEIVEKRELTNIKDLVSKQYSDEQLRDKRAIIQIATAYIWRHKNIHLFTKTKNLVFPQVDKASVQLYVAMADLPILSAESLYDLKARLYRFDLALSKEEDQWRLVNADWWPASLDDF